MEDWEGYWAACSRKGESYDWKNGGRPDRSILVWLLLVCFQSVGFAARKQGKKGSWSRLAVILQILGRPLSVRVYRSCSGTAAKLPDARGQIPLYPCKLNPKQT
eukprot:1047054-Pelagomonas_calceolata.AAC.1